MTMRIADNLTDSWQSRKAVDEVISGGVEAEGGWTERQRIFLPPERRKTKSSEIIASSFG